MPFLRKWNEPADEGSYCPIALSYVIAKLLVKLIAHRLSWWLEESSTLILLQASFRKGRSTTDHCLRKSQFISDGFQSIQLRRTIATFFELIREYDRVWRTGLLVKMSMMGVLSRFTEWLSTWLMNRTDRVKAKGSIGPTRNSTEGLPQGSVLSSLLFTIYMNDLMAEFEKDTLVSAYADDVLTACCARNKDMIVASPQPEVYKVVARSDKARLTHSTSKSETAFISLDCAEAAWQSNITTDGKRMFCNTFQVFLCVRCDRQLTFAEHLRKLCQSTSGRFNLFRALGGTTWGWYTSEIRQVYTVIVRMMLEYAATA